MSLLKSLLASSLTPDSGRASYRDLLVQFRKRSSSDPIFHRYPWQARQAFAELLELAIEAQSKQPAEPKVVRVLSGEFPWKVYGENPVRDLFVKFLELKGSLKVLIWNDRLTESRSLLHSFHEISLAAGGSFEVRLSGTTKNGEKISHLFLVGDRAYRVENPHPIYPTESVTDVDPIFPARVCFNDPSGSEKYRQFFDEVWAVCQQTLTKDESFAAI